MQVVVPISSEERRPNDVVPFKYIPWREAIALYPMPSVMTKRIEQSELENDSFQFEVDELPEDFEPDPEIQDLIRMSLENDN